MRILAVISLLVFASCSKREPENPVGFTQRRVIFKEDKYHPFPACAITLLVPVEYDTLLKWVDWSDNSASDISKYRFTNSRGCLIQESGFFKKADGFCKDTLDRLTIYPQQIYGDGEWTMKSLNETAFQTDKRDSIICKTKSLWRLKKIEKINERQFVIISRRGPGYFFCDPYEQLSAGTNFRYRNKQCHISFVFECKNKNNRDFEKRAYTVLKSIKIDTLIAN